MKKLINKNNKHITILSPIEGKVCKITEVNDPTFGDMTLGDGIAIIPTKGKVVSPVDGKIFNIFPTKHAISIIGDQGVEVLIHIGIDTVELNGRFFKTYVHDEENVNAGDLLLEFDMAPMIELGYDLICPIVICNSHNYGKINKNSVKLVKSLDPIMKLRKL
jgi:PTS system beta-glucosides-specific IIC component